MAGGRRGAEDRRADTRPPAFDPADVVTSQFNSRSRGRRRASASRALDTSSLLLRLMHRPTGITVEAELPPGHYSRKEMLRLRDELWARLMPELEAQVLRALRVSGRTA